MSDENNINSLPAWFKVVSAIALIWNLLGVYAFIDQMMMTPEKIASLAEAEQALYMAVPIWVNIAFAFAVIGGAFGCLLLLLKKAIAFPVLILSLAGVCTQMLHAFFISDAWEVYGPASAIMPAMIVTIAILLVWLSKKAQTNDWII